MSHIVEVSGARRSEKVDKYLGLPSLVGKSRYKAFKSIRNKMLQKVHNWKNIFLSLAGREILFKLVI